MSNATPLVLAVMVAELAPAAAFALAAEQVARAVGRLRIAARLLLPIVLVLPYLAVSAASHIFRWKWFALYAGLPVAMAWLLLQAAERDPEQRGNWRDALILLVLGLSVDLRWFDAAWPHGQESLGKILLVDAGLYGFLATRKLEGSGFNFWLRWSDWKIGLRELTLFAPLVLVFGLALGFIHPHANAPSLAAGLLRWLEIFAFVALPEELFFRGWVQNLLERRLGRWAALAVTSVLFGLSHFNKKNFSGAHFNWRYVLLATVAGIFYGRAWRDQRRLPASTITHTFVDWLWSWWF
jgi:membrane protease YdiL (CAAX protease family)